MPFLVQSQRHFYKTRMLLVKRGKVVLLHVWTQRESRGIWLPVPGVNHLKLKFVKEVVFLFTENDIRWVALYQSRSQGFSLGGEKAWERGWACICVSHVTPTVFCVRAVVTVIITVYLL